MLTVGCSEGHDATAWSTRILRPDAKLQHVNNGQAIPFSVMECEFAPKQGRSGGGLYTEDGFVAGVCDFADTSSNRGLYATPASIYRILDRNRLAMLYRPEAGGSQRLLADNEGGAKRGNTRLRGQTPREGDGSKITLPEPGMIGIPQPKLAASNPEDRPSVPKGTYTWKTRNPTPGSSLGVELEPPKGTTTAEMVADPSPSDLDRRPSDSEADPAAPLPEAAPSSISKGQWKPIRMSNGSL